VSDTELSPKSKLEPVRRLEVFTGSGRRRSWTGDQKAEILAESYESGEKVSAVARRHGLTPQQVFGWRREAQRQARRQARDDQGEASGAAFAPVIVEQALSRSVAPAAPNRSGGTASIEISWRRDYSRRAGNRRGDPDDGVARRRRPGSRAYPNQHDRDRRHCAK
jgi:transposase-like protein